MSQPYPPQQPAWGPPPPPPKKTSAGKILGLGCAGIIGLVIAITIIGAIASSSGDKESSSPSAVKPAASASANKQPAASTEPSKAPKTEAKKVVTFKVWGTAPAGALGPLDITYGSDGDTRKGTFKDGKFEATLPLDNDALYFNVMAQLQGSGDINCSVTVDGHTKKGHASGGYNICNAQANAGLLGGWG